MSEPRLPRAIVDKIISEIKARPEDRSILIATYLPLLTDYAISLFHTSKVFFAQFKLYFINQWRTVFPDIPIPDFEGVLNYDTMIKKFLEHLLTYRDRIYIKLGVHGVRSGLELEQLLKFKLVDIIYNSVIGVLKFKGEI